jgi:hypothetical protein
MKTLTLTLSHAYREMRERTTKQAEGKDHPPGGRVAPSLAAITATGKKKYGARI